METGAKLIAYCDNTAAATAQTTCSSPANQLITFGAGSLTNYGTLNSEPIPTETAGGKSYALTDNVVSITNPGSTPTIVDNYGSIGDDTLSNCSFCGPPGYYGQGDPAAILIAGQATVTNEPSGYLSGYNAFFTESGNGVFNNYGVVFGVNDGLLTGYLINNYENAGIVTGVAGFANMHNYNDVTNYGYILGADYAILAQNANGTIDDYGGPQVAGITDFEGHPVYNGEISAIPRNATVPNPNPTPIGTPELGGASFEIIAPNVTVNLYDRVIGGTTYFPMILGPMDGGFNGSFANATASIKGAVINFSFPDLPAAQANAFKSAIAASRTSNANGTFYTGTYTLTYGGVTFPYEWANVPTVEFDGVTP